MSGGNANCPCSLVLPLSLGVRVLGVLAVPPDSIGLGELGVGFRVGVAAQDLPIVGSLLDLLRKPMRAPSL